MPRCVSLVGRAYTHAFCGPIDLHCCLTSLLTQQCHNDVNNSSHKLPHTDKKLYFVFFNTKDS